MATTGARYDRCFPERFDVEPYLLGGKYNMKIQSFDEYSEDVDPSVSNSFATAALRFINSMMEGQLK